VQSLSFSDRVDMAGGVKLRVGNLTGSGQKFMFGGALALYSSGLALRYWAARSLGSWFSRSVEACPDQTLVSGGPYRFLRHPLYLGLFLLGVGLNGLMANPFGVTISVFILAIVLNLRMVEEERVLESTIGSRYRAWKSKRYRFVPFFY
jgi:protein-S-isoprenylcysteine O-methyltransferase Ste14